MILQIYEDFLRAGLSYSITLYGQLQTEILSGLVIWFSYRRYLPEWVHPLGTDLKNPLTNPISSDPEPIGGFD